MLSWSRYWQDYPALAAVASQKGQTASLHSELAQRIWRRCQDRSKRVVTSMLGTPGLPKGPSYDGQALHASDPGLFALTDPVKYASHRKPWTRGFSAQALKEYEPVLAARVHQFVDLLASRRADVDFAKYVSYFAYDFMSDMAFGGGSEMMCDGYSDGLWNMLEEGLSVSQIFEHLPWLAHLVRRIPQAGEKLKELCKMGRARAEARRKKGSSTKDLFYYLSNDDSAESISPSSAQIASEGILAIVAGSDTVSALLSHAIYFLRGHLESYKRLQAEIDQYYPPGEDATDKRHFSKMNYLQAVIDESFRLLPPVLSGTQRAPMSGSGGKMIGSYFFLEGTQARVHFYSVHHDRRNFSPDPDSFGPTDGSSPMASSHRRRRSSITCRRFAVLVWSAKLRRQELGVPRDEDGLVRMLAKVGDAFAHGWDPREWEQSLEDTFIIKKGRLPIVVSLRDGA